MNHQCFLPLLRTVQTNPHLGVNEDLNEDFLLFGEPASHFHLLPRLIDFNISKFIFYFTSSIITNDNTCKIREPDLQFRKKKNHHQNQQKKASNDTNKMEVISEASKALLQMSVPLGQPEKDSCPMFFSSVRIKPSFRCLTIRCR